MLKVAGAFQSLLYASVIELKWIDSANILTVTLKCTNRESQCQTANNKTQQQIAKVD